VSVKITISKENYLKAIAEAESEGETVIAATLARWLNVSAPAVTMAVKRLKRDGLLEVSAEGHISLTGSGREIASRLLARHHLIERMLTEIFGMEWYKVHDEAEQLEHAVSADFERRLTEKLGSIDGSCPHGNLIGMDTPRDRRRRGLLPLAECEAADGGKRLRARPQAARIPGRRRHPPGSARRRGFAKLRRDGDATHRREQHPARQAGSGEGLGPLGGRTRRKPRAGRAFRRALRFDIPVAAGRR
jgi:Mn-dependent DtxR family transcriptional regulator